MSIGHTQLKILQFQLDRYESLAQHHSEHIDVGTLNCEAALTRCPIGVRFGADFHILLLIKLEMRAHDPGPHSSAFFRGMQS